MGLQYRKGKVKLGYLEEKPEVYKAIQLTYPQVSYEQLVEEIAQSRGVNTNSTRAVVDALLNRLVHYMEIGHGVSLGTFGSFKPVFHYYTDEDGNQVEYPKKRRMENGEEVFEKLDGLVYEAFRREEEFWLEVDNEEIISMAKDILSVS